MKEVIVKTYSINELSEEAKEKAHEWYLGAGFEYHWLDEAIESLKVFCGNFNVTLRNWSIDSQRIDIHWTLEAIDEQVQELQGERLSRYLWGNHFGDIFKGKYYGKLVDDATAKHGTRHIKRYSKVLFEMNMSTGYCMDCSILQPIFDFVHKPIVGYTFNDLIQDCINSFESDLKSDLEEQESLNYFIEHANANGYQFTKSGKFFTERGLQ